MQVDLTGQLDVARGSAACLRPTSRPATPFEPAPILAPCSVLYDATSSAKAACRSVQREVGLLCTTKGAWLRGFPECTEHIPLSSQRLLTISS